MALRRPYLTRHGQHQSTHPAHFHQVGRRRCRRHMGHRPRHSPRPDRRQAPPRHHRLRRAGPGQPEAARRRAHRRALRRRPERPRPGRRAVSRRAQGGRLPPSLRPPHGVRRRRCQHHRAHARVRHAARPAIEEARLLREAARVQRAADAAHPRGCREGRRRHADGHAGPRQRQLPPRRRAHPVGHDRQGDRVPRLGGARVGVACQRGRRDGRQRHRVRAGSPGRRRPGAREHRVGPLARPRPRPAVQQRLSSRAQVVPLVGLRQRDDERSGQPLDRPAVLGAEAACAGDHRGQRPARASADRARVDAGAVPGTGRWEISPS